MFVGQKLKFLQKVSDITHIQLTTKKTCPTRTSVTEFDQTAHRFGYDNAVGYYFGFLLRRLIAVIVKLIDDSLKSFS